MSADSYHAGVPLRIEVGPKDLANQSFLYARRDTGAKASLKLDASAADNVKVAWVVDAYVAY